MSFEHLSGSDTFSNHALNLTHFIQSQFFLNFLIQSWPGFKMNKFKMNKFKKNLWLGPSERHSVKYFSVFPIFMNIFSRYYSRSIPYIYEMPDGLISCYVTELHWQPSTTGAWHYGWKQYIYDVWKRIRE